MFWNDTRVAPTGMEVALMMLPGGWPATVMTARAFTAGWARSVVPGTEKERVEVVVCWTGLLVRKPAPMKRTRIKSPIPGTIMAAFMLNPARGGGRSGACACACTPASWTLMAPRSYVPPDHPKWSMGPCPAPSRHPAPPASPRATKALAARTASSTP